MMRCSSIVLLAVLGFAAPVRAQPLWADTQGLSGRAFDTWFNEHKQLDYRLVYLNGFNVNGTTFHSARMVKETKTPLWKYAYGKSHDDFVKFRNDVHKQGYRQISLSGYLKGQAPAFAGAWVKDGLRTLESVSLNLTEKEYRDTIARQKMSGHLPAQVTGYADGAGSYRFAALFVPAGRAFWYECHDLTAEEYQKAIDETKTNKCRPISVTVYPTPAGLRFAVVLLQDGAEWFARHNLSFEDYKTEFNQAETAGFRPVSIAGYSDGNRGGPELFDQAMQKFMTERNIKAGTLTVSRGGKLLWSQGYGAKVDDPFRIASLTKPITAAAVRTLIREKKLSLDDKAFPLLGLKPLPGQTPDPRLNNITIGHLLDHQGGWDHAKTFDPMFESLKIAAALKAPAPPSPVDIVRYMMGQPLQFDPGSRKSYSNFGYCVLGRVIEKVSGKPCTAYIKDMLAPLGIRSVELGRTLPRFRNPREPAYLDPGKGRNVLDPQSEEKVPAPDGTFYLEAMDAHGGLTASAPDLVRFLEAYWVSGEKRSGNGYHYTFFGSLPGTFTMVMQRPNGVNVAVLFNQRADMSRRPYEQIEELMRDAADRQAVGSVRYAALWVKGG